MKFEIIEKSHKGRVAYYAQECGWEAMLRDMFNMQESSFIKSSKAVLDYHGVPCYTSIRDAQDAIDEYVFRTYPQIKTVEYTPKLT